jgi:hypothetical protein
VRAARLFLQLLEERTVPTVALFDAAGQFVRNFAGAGAVGQAIASGIENAHLVIYNDAVYSDFVADVAGQTILGRQVGGTYSDYGFRADANVSAVGPAVTARPTIQASGSGTTVRLAADGISVDNLDIRDGAGINPVGLRVAADNTALTNSVIEQHGIGVVVAAGVDGLEITQSSVTGNTGDGIRFDGGAATQNVSVQSSLITGNGAAGVRFDPAFSGSTVTVTDDDLSGNGGSAAVVNASAVAVNFSFDWWGGPNYPAVTGPIDVSPYLLSGDADGDPGDGFQPALGALAVTPLGVQTGAVGRIQEAVDGAAPGATITVAAGTYTETVTIDEPLTLLGPNAAVPAGPGRSDEATIDGGAGTTITVTAGDQVVKGFTVLGDSGIQSTTSVGSFDVENNIVSTVNAGINISGAAAVTAFGNRIASTTGDGIDLLDVSGPVQIGGPAAGQGNAITVGPTASGIFAVWVQLAGAPITVQGNAISGGSVGINIFNDSHGAITVGGTTAAEGNTVAGSDTGIFIRVSIGGLSVQHNTVTDAGTYGIRISGAGLVAGYAAGVPIQIRPTEIDDNLVSSSTSGDTGLLFDDGIDDQYHYYNEVTGKRDTVIGFTTGIRSTNEGDIALDHLTISDVRTGIDIDGESGRVWPMTLSITSGSITAEDEGVDFEGNGYDPGANSLTLTGTTITITGADGVGVELADNAVARLENVAIVLSAAAGTTAVGIDVAGGQLSLGTGVSVVSGQTGLVFRNDEPKTVVYAPYLSENSLATISFAGQTGDYVDVEPGALAGQEVDATAASFDRFVGGTAAVTTTADLAAFFAVGAKITDALDGGGAGFVRLRAGSVFVGQDDEDAAAGAIQRGLDVAAADDTVFVQAGTFAGGLVVGRPVTLRGVQADINPVPGRAGGEAIISGNGTGATVQVAAGTAGVTIDGFTIQGPGDGVAVAGTGATITDDIIRGTANGVVVTGGGSAALLTNTITGNGVGVLVDGGAALLQGNDLRDNTADGLVIKDNAAVDAGQDDPTTTTVEGTNFTGLGISQGGNLFDWSATPGTGYSAAGAKAIVNENAFAGLPGSSGPVQPPNVPAEYNDFGTSVDGNIKQIVVDYYHDPSTAVVDYRNAVRAVTALSGMYAVGSGPGQEPLVKLFNPDGSIKLSFDAYDKSFTGGVSVAVGDVNGDGTPDVITGAGPGGGPHVKVFSGVDGSLLDSFFAYGGGFSGGVRVAAADVNGDGKADIITGAGPGGGPHVKVFSGADLALLASFFAYDAGFTGGIFVAAGDVTGDGHADIVTGAGAGGGPHVKAFDGPALLAGGSAGQLAVDRPLYSFFAFGKSFAGGVSVAVGDVNGDGLADIIAGAGPGGGPHVKVFSGGNGGQLASFFAYDASFTGGVSVAAADVNGDGLADIVTGAGPGGGPHVKAFSGTDLSLLASFFAYDPTVLGGVFVG